MGTGLKFCQKMGGIKRKVGAFAELKLEALQKEAPEVYFFLGSLSLDREYGKMWGKRAAIFHFFLPMAMVQEYGGSRESINSLALV